MTSCALCWASPKSVKQGTQPLAITDSELIKA
jgi:hypothetical protein